MSSKKTPDYRVHDDIYKKTKAGGFDGWGGPRVAERIREWEKEVECLVRHFDEWPKRGRILELGCGEGKLSFILAQAGYDVVGIDISETAIAWAKEKADARGLTVDFRAMSVVDLGCFSGVEFDIVFDALCTHCIIGEDRAAMYGGIKRALKRGGLFYLNCVYGGRENSNAERAKEFDEETHCDIRDGRPYRYIGTEKALTDELSEHGFELLRKEALFVKGKPHKLKVLARNS